MRGLLGLSAAVVGLLSMSGCGGAGAGLESFTNLLNLDGGELVGISRAADTSAPSAEQSFQRTFEDRRFGGRPGGGGRWQLAQGLGRVVRVEVPEGASLPVSFSLSNLTLSLSISDGEREMERTTTVAGPVLFTRTGESNQYSTETMLTPETAFTEGSFETLQAILTTAPSPNMATVTLRYDSSDTLPAGTLLRFGLERGQAHRH